MLLDLARINSKQDNIKNKCKIPTGPKTLGNLICLNNMTIIKKYKNDDIIITCCMFNLNLTIDKFIKNLINIIKYINCVKKFPKIFI